MLVVITMEIRTINGILTEDSSKIDHFHMVMIGPIVVESIDL